MQVMDVPQGRFELVRVPYSGNKTLRAWDAADEYALAHLREVETEAPGGGTLLVNDAFGALSVSLSGRRPQMLSDSFLSHLAVKENLVRNGMEAGTVRSLGSLDVPKGPLSVVLAKVPKTLALLEDQLHRIRPLLSPDTLVVGAGMTRNIHTSTVEMFEKIIGATTTSLARKKARLLFARLDEDLAPGPSPYPTSHRLDTGLEVVCHANVFSRRRLDVGTRLLLQHLPSTTGAVRVADLGCGSGILGTVAALRNPDATMLFADESYMAVASAEATFRGAVGPDRRAEFRVTDVLDGVAADSVDIVLNNPPFHDGHVKGDAIAWRMFVESRRRLCVGGQLYVVGNRHLDYQDKLKHIFGNCDVVASNAKFSVLRARRR